MPRSIAHEHLHGATVWAFGGGSARVVAWTRREHFGRLEVRA
jgi:hypothetical protein